LPRTPLSQMFVFMAVAHGGVNGVVLAALLAGDPDRYQVVCLPVFEEFRVVEVSGCHEVSCTQSGGPGQPSATAPPNSSMPKVLRKCSMSGWRIEGLTKQCFRPSASAASRMRSATNPTSR